MSSKTNITAITAPAMAPPLGPDELELPSEEEVVVLVLVVLVVVAVVGGLAASIWKASMVSAPPFVAVFVMTTLWLPGLRFVW